jgi:CRISPR type III-A-associated RAMP protein Csm4
VAAVRVSSPVFATKLRWRAVRFVPVTLVENLLLGQRLLADQWFADPESKCLLRRDRPQTSPFRPAVRTSVAVDRLGAGQESHSLACIEFEPGAGLWAVANFRDAEAAAEWREPLLGVLRLLADSGLGGRRSSGWGQISSIRSQEGQWPALLVPKLARRKPAPEETNGNHRHHWLLSLYSPAAVDRIDWTTGSYSLATRTGHVDTTRGERSWKKAVRMVEEGSVLAAAEAPIGSAVDTAPDGFAHPVYRAGFALSLPLPVVKFAAIEEPAPTELEQALGEALKAAAEEGAKVEAEGAALEEAIPEVSEEAAKSLEDMGSVPVSAPEDEGSVPTTEAEESKAQGSPVPEPELPEPEESGQPERIEHTLIDEQPAPQTVFEEPPTTPESEQPDRLNIEEDRGKTEEGEEQ